MFKAGDVMFVPAGASHNATDVGKATAKVLVTWVLEKGPAGYAREVRRAFSSFTSTVYSGSTSWTMGAREFCATN